MEAMVLGESPKQGVDGSDYVMTSHHNIRVIHKCLT